MAKTLNIEAVFRRNFDAVFRLCYSYLGSPADAEDAAQEAYLRLWRNLDRLPNEAAANSFLYKTAYRICVDLLRARKRFREPERPPAQNDALSDGMTAALLKLSPADRAVVYCRVVEEEDYGAIAARFGKNEAWARKRFSLARKKLRLTLEKEDKHNDGF